MTDRYRLIGGAGSPYSMKIRALMRYRRIPFDWMLRNHVGDEVAHVKPPVIPILHNRQDDSYRNDSTPLVSYLEEQVPTPRSVIPDDPCDAFLSYLIEDLAEERHRGEHVGLVDASEQALATLRLAFAREVKAEAM